MRINKVKLITNPKKEWAKETARQIKELIEDSEFQVAPSNADLTICIGGDGTILFANHDGKIEGAVLGIGGDKSKICLLHKDNWKKYLLQLMRLGKTERRQMLLGSFGKKTLHAINDFVIHSNDYRIIEITLWINGRKHFFEGDGLILSSATGSYAYAYSAGGKRLRPRSKRIQAVPIAPYLRAFKPHILPSNTIFEITIDRKCAFIVDGIFIDEIKPDQRIKIKSGGFIRFLSK
jgi:NAD+ kinase